MLYVLHYATNKNNLNDIYFFRNYFLIFPVEKYGKLIFSHHNYSLSFVKSTKYDSVIDVY